MIREPSIERALNTIDGEEYASLVTHVQWNVYVINRNVIMPTNAHATSFLTPDWCSNFFDFLKSLFVDNVVAVVDGTVAGLLMYFDKRCETVMPEMTHITGANTNIKRTITPAK